MKGAGGEEVVRKTHRISDKVFAHFPTHWLVAEKLSRRIAVSEIRDLGGTLAERIFHAAREALSGIPPASRPPCRPSSIVQIALQTACIKDWSVF